MSSVQAPTDIREFLASDERTPGTYDAIRAELCRDPRLRSDLVDAAERLADDPAALGRRLSKAKAAGRRAIALWLLGDMENAEKELSEAGSEAEVDFELGRCRIELGLYDRAIEALKGVRKSDPNYNRVVLLIAEADTRSGRSGKALPVLEQIVATKPSADAYYELGLALDGEGRPIEAVQAYEKALELDPDHNGATFRLGYEYVLAGDPEKAMGHYRRLSEHMPAYASALLNLGLLYEDMGQVRSAIECYRRVLKANPSHSRARLYLHDALAATDMFYDPEEQKERTRKDEILSIPITDFELSVRSRNCLAKMNIRTLGDLVVKSEEELLSYKNFGETSLQEIKDMLSSKGLLLGSEHPKEPAEPVPAPAAAEPEAQAPGGDLLSMSPNELQLSVRCRKCLERLNITTIGELAQVTEDELLSVRNFGRTSLEEIKSKLAAHGLSLSDGTRRGAR
jgi:DNA-directed RNA polymerase subunit alpha